MLPLLTTLIVAMIAVESHGDPIAKGNAGELGCLQITQAVIDDVNRIQGHVRFVHADALNPKCAREICRIYLEHYATPARIGRRPTLQDIARIWNGGPTGWMKPETLPYWEKVKKELP